MQSGVVVIFFSNNVNFNSLACIEKFVCHSICIVGDNAKCEIDQDWYRFYRFFGVVELNIGFHFNVV